MTPEELEALADRVENESASLEIDRAVFAALGTHVLETRDRDRKAWWYPVRPGNGCKADDHTINGVPRFTASLDAADQVMPAGWRVVTIYETAFGKISASYAHREHGWGASGTAPTECAARVAAGLRARAHEARKAGAK